jgi:sugar/nucleoside kinase (ribokinase family)
LLGGTAAYSGLTARALGLRTRVLTSCGPDLDQAPLAGLEVMCLRSESSTIFENLYISGRRQQTIHSQACMITAADLPESWRAAGIIHVAPVAQEIDPLLIDSLSYSLLGVTPQGWMRSWDQHGRVQFRAWSDETSLLQSAEATILSLEDVGGDESLIASLAQRSRILVVTQAANGARVYWRGQRRDFPAPQVRELDSTGSGDIFAACFLVRLHQSRDPWEAARFANLLAAASVTRSGLNSVPLAEEIRAALEL